MRAFVVTGPGVAEVREVAPPVAGPGEVVVDVRRAGVGGTDAEFFSGRPSLLDTRDLVLKDVTAVGVPSASGGLAGTIARYASGAVDPRPLVAATVGLDEVAGVQPDSKRRGTVARTLPRSGVEQDGSHDC
ncbi:hypothetical protein [Plantactinospora sp. DSM 117369]